MSRTIYIARALVLDNAALPALTVPVYRVFLVPSNLPKEEWPDARMPCSVSEWVGSPEFERRVAAKNLRETVKAVKQTLEDLGHRVETGALGSFNESQF